MIPKLMVLTVVKPLLTQWQNLRQKPRPSILVWRRQWHPTPVLLPGKSHGRRSLVDCSLWGAESDTTERLHFHFSLSCTGEGNGNPLQYSCLGNLMDRGAWWATVHGVTKSQTLLSDNTFTCCCFSTLIMTEQEIFWRFSPFFPNPPLPTHTHTHTH